MSSNELQQSPRWQRRPEDRPDEILDAATTVFGEQGFARTRLEDVAKRAGVSKGTLYLYFDSKESLFREMVRRNVVSVVAEERFLRIEVIALRRRRRRNTSIIRAPRARR